MRPLNSKPRMQIRPNQRGGYTPVRAKYEGASLETRMSGKGIHFGGQNDLVAQSIDVLRSRARYAGRNSSLGVNGREKYAANMVGVGITPSFGFADAELNAQAQALWGIWAQMAGSDGESLYSQQYLHAMSQFESGASLALFRPRYSNSDLPVPLQVQALDIDHLDHKYDDLALSIQQGIERNNEGQKSFYHIWKKHPQEFDECDNKRQRIPARDVMHIYRKTRPGQLHGVPELASVIVQIYEYGEMQDSVLLKQKTAALFAAFVQSAAGAEPPQMGEPEEDEYDESGEGIASIKAGAVHYLEEGEEVVFSNPPDIGSSYVEWIKTVLREIAMGMGLTVEQLTGDLSDVNYSSIRAGLIEFRRRMEALQIHLMVDQFCKPVMARWLDICVANGLLDLPNYWEYRYHYHAQIKWSGPKWEWVDPLKDAMADLLEMRSGTASRTEKAAERNRDSAQLDREIQQDNERADQLGLVFDSDPRRTAKSGALQPLEQAALDLILNQDRQEASSAMV